MLAETLCLKKYVVSLSLAVGKVKRASPVRMTPSYNSRGVGAGKRLAKPKLCNIVLHSAISMRAWVLCQSKKKAPFLQGPSLG